MIDTLEQYLQEIDTLEQGINMQDFNDVAHESHKEYLLTKAGYQFLLGNGQATKSTLQAFYKKNALYKKMIELDLRTEYHLTQNMISASGDLSFFDTIKDQPRIFCTFHFGAYQSIVTYLKLHYVDLYIVTIKGYKINELISYDTTREEYSDKDIDAIQSNSWSSLIELSNKLKEGKSIVVFLDRQDISDNANEKVALVDLLGKEVRVKRGIPEISFIRDVPVVPVVCYRNSNVDVSIHFHEAVQKQKGEHKKDYANRVLQSTFHVFSDYIRSSPEQWEYWSELHHIIDISKAAAPTPVVEEAAKEASVRKRSLLGRLFGAKTKGKKAERNSSLSTLHFNDDEYGIFKEEETNYLLNLTNFQCYKISANLSYLIKHVQEGNQNWQTLGGIVNESLCNDLKKNRIFL